MRLYSVFSFFLHFFEGLQEKELFAVEEHYISFLSICLLATVTFTF